MQRSSFFCAYDPFETTVFLLIYIHGCDVQTLRHWGSSSEQNRLLVLLELVFQLWEKDECWTWCVRLWWGLRRKSKEVGYLLGEGVAVFSGSCGIPQTHLRSCILPVADLVWCRGRVQGPFPRIQEHLISLPLSAICLLFPAQIIFTFSEIEINK